MSKPLPINDNVVIVDRGFDTSILGMTESLWAELDEKYGDFAGRSLISCFSFDADWPTWEVHPAGDEFALLLQGDIEMILAQPGGDETVRLSEPGTFVIVPKNTWHTGRVHAPTRMLFVTPGEGTINAEQPERGGT